MLRLGWLLPLVALGVAGGVLLLTYAFASIPLPQDIRLSSAAEVYDANGRLIGIFSGEERRFLIDTRDLLDNPRSFIDEAIISSEDRDFYQHNGLSVRGMARAAWTDITSGQIEQGGSTLSQQYVKIAVLNDPERTVTRKLKEAILAVKLERRYSKDQILGFYLNTVYFGRGAYGIEAAARTYFDKHADELDLGEAAFLAGIIPAPEAYQPDRRPRLARQRRDNVLEVMEQEGYITKADIRKYSKEKVKISPSSDSQTDNKQKAAYFLEWIRRRLEREYGNALYTGGLKIYTTLDLEMQRAAEEAVAASLGDKEDPQASLVSVTPQGSVKAFVGGRAFHNLTKARGFNFATDNYRQAGSAFKPFTLLSAIEEGVSINSEYSGESPYVVHDGRCEKNGAWPVNNFGSESFDYLNLDEATTNSVNTIYAQLISEIGPEKVATLVERMGFDGDQFEEGINPVAPHCSLALGTLDVTPLDLARAYAAFAGGGLMPKVEPVAYVEDANGRCLRVYGDLKQGKDCGRGDVTSAERIADENSVNVMNGVLQNVVAEGTATSADIGRPVAGKTGTTSNNVNAWFGGYTPQLATVVWMGYPKQKDGVVPEMRYCADTNLCRPVNGLPEVTGGSIPTEIWASFMIDAMAIGEYPIKPFDIGNDLGTVTGTPPPEPTPTETEEVEETPTEEPTTPPPSEEPPTPAPSQPPTTEPGPTIEPGPTPGPTRLPGPPTPTTDTRTSIEDSDTSNEDGGSSGTGSSGSGG